MVNIRFTTLLALVSSIVLSACVTQDFENGETPVVKNQANRDDMAATRISLGLGYLKMGNMPQAKQNLEKAKKFSPEMVQVYTAFAHYYETVGEHKLTIESYEKALTLKSDDADTLNNYGVYLCRQDKIDEAEKQFLKAIAVPSYLLVAKSYENLASCFLQKDNFVKAEIYLNKAILHSPSSSSTLLQMVRMQYAMADYPQAKQFVQRFEKVTRRFTSQSLALTYKVYLKLGQKRTAKNYGTMLVKMYPQSWEAQQYLLNELELIDADNLAKRYQLTQVKLQQKSSKKRIVKLSPRKSSKSALPSPASSTPPLQKKPVTSSLAVNTNQITPKPLSSKPEATKPANTDAVNVSSANNSTVVASVLDKSVGATMLATTAVASAQTINAALSMTPVTEQVSTNNITNNTVLTDLPSAQPATMGNSINTNQMALENGHQKRELVLSAPENTKTTIVAAAVTSAELTPNNVEKSKESLVKTEPAIEPAKIVNAESAHIEAAELVEANTDIPTESLVAEEVLENTSENPLESAVDPIVETAQTDAKQMSVQQAVVKTESAVESELVARAMVVSASIEALASTDTVAESAPASEGNEIQAQVSAEQSIVNTNTAEKLPIEDREIFHVAKKPEPIIETHIETEPIIVVEKAQPKVTKAQESEQVATDLAMVTEDENTEDANIEAESNEVESNEVEINEVESKESEETKVENLVDEQSNEQVSEKTTDKASEKVTKPVTIKKPAVHTVGKGDTLYSISVKYNVKIKAIRRWNNLSSKRKIRINDKLYVQNPNVVRK